MYGSAVFGGEGLNLEWRNLQLNKTLVIGQDSFLDVKEEQSYRRIATRFPRNLFSLLEPALRSRVPSLYLARPTQCPTMAERNSELQAKLQELDNDFAVSICDLRNANNCPYTEH